MNSFQKSFIIAFVIGFAFIQNNNSKDLPKILIIGDSISLGYTPFVANILKDKAIVQHHEGNARYTGYGLEMLDSWLGDTGWDVIHFNWGLWDLCYRHPQSKVYGNRDKQNGELTTTLKQYEENLEQLVLRLKETNAELIWAHATFVPEGEPGRFKGDDKKYNDIATTVMEKHHIPINDLNSFTSEFNQSLFVGPGDVHYTEEGYRQIAVKVADEILAALNK